MKELSLHILDIAENSLAAGATRIEIKVEDRMETDKFRIEINDNGKGMDVGMAASVTDPFVTTRTTRKVGLGIPLLKEAAEACNGSLELRSSIGKGTSIVVDFQRNHIDRMPLGDLSGTWMTLLVTHPEIAWLMEYKTDDSVFIMESSEIVELLEGLPMSDPTVLSFLRTYLEDGLRMKQMN